MIKRIVYFSFIVLTACQSIEAPEKPKTLIGEDQMVTILTDIAFVKAAKSSYKKVFDLEKINPETYILQKHGIDSLVFAENNRWYIGQIEKYKDIFNRVKSNLEASKTEYARLKKEEDSLRMVKDSIKKVNGDVIVVPKDLELNEEELSIEEDIEKAKKKRFKKTLPLKKKKKSQ